MATKTATNFLHHVKTILDKEETPCEIHPKAIDNKIDTLFIPFQDTGVGITLTHITSQEFKAADVPSDCSLLQFHVAIPIQVEKTVLPSIAEFIQRLNLYSPLPGWILDRTSNAIHYRYVLVGNEQPPSDEVFQYVMNVLSFYMTNFLPILIDVCVGREKLEEAINKLQKALP